MNSLRRGDLDFLKGIAILAIVMYHFGILPMGYLGVEIFFIVNGYLMIPKIIGLVGDSTFSYQHFISSLIRRFLSLILIVSAICLIVGYFVLLPDDFENLGESVVATSVFGNNILQTITIRNYFALINAYKPLMHTWFIAVLVQFYVVFSLIVILTRSVCRRLNRDFGKTCLVVISLMSLMSFASLFVPSEETSRNFYLLHSRFFEIAIGGIVGILSQNRNRPASRALSYLPIALVVLMIVVLSLDSYHIRTIDIHEYSITTGELISRESYTWHVVFLSVMSLLTVAYLFFTLSSGSGYKYAIANNRNLLAKVGLMSFSVFMWHQPIIAFYRYIVNPDVGIAENVWLFVATIIVAIPSYRYIEQPLKRQVTRKIKILLFAAFVVVNSFALCIYYLHGVVRDVPELNIVDRQQREDYVSNNLAAYKLYEHQFESENRIKVLLVGNSFVRDWAMILRMSPIADRIEMSYVYSLDSKYSSLIAQSDIVFVAMWREYIDTETEAMIGDMSKVWCIGVKNFGSCYGQVYSQRASANYHQKTVAIKPIFFDLNQSMRQNWGERYIDMLEPVCDKETRRVRVFSDDGKFLSWDGLHLCEAGARYYSAHLDWNHIFYCQNRQ